MFQVYFKADPDIAKKLETHCEYLEMNRCGCIVPKYTFMPKRFGDARFHVNYDPSRVGKEAKAIFMTSDLGNSSIKTVLDNLRDICGGIESVTRNLLGTQQQIEVYNKDNVEYSLM